MSSSSSQSKQATTQTAYNQQMALDTGGASGVAVGAGASTGNITIQNTDMQALQESLGAAAHINDTAQSTAQAGIQAGAIATQSALKSNAETTGAALQANTNVTTAALVTGEAQTKDALEAGVTQSGQAFDALKTIAASNTSVTHDAIQASVQSSTNANATVLAALNTTAATISQAETLNATQGAQFTQALENVTLGSEQLGSSALTGAISTADNLASGNGQQADFASAVTSGVGIPPGEVLLVAAAAVVIVLFLHRNG